MAAGGQPSADATPTSVLLVVAQIPAVCGGCVLVEIAGRSCRQFHLQPIHRCTSSSLCILLCSSSLARITSKSTRDCLIFAADGLIIQTGAFQGHVLHITFFLDCCLVVIFVPLGSGRGELQVSSSFLFFP